MLKSSCDEQKFQIIKEGIFTLKGLNILAECLGQLSKLPK